jgi:hypothetical protein
MISALPSYPNPNNVEAPMAPATQAQAARPGAPPDKDEDEIDDGWCEKEERDETWQHMVQGPETRKVPGNAAWQHESQGERCG